MNREEIKAFLKKVGGCFEAYIENEEYLRGFEDGQKGKVGEEINSNAYFVGWEDGFVYSIL